MLNGLIKFFDQGSLQIGGAVGAHGFEQHSYRRVSAKGRHFD
jgi:hypothetical protein